MPRHARRDTTGTRPRGALPWIGPVLASASFALLLGVDPARAAETQHAPRLLLVHVRDTPPRGAPAYHRERDGSYTVSTGGGGDQDDRAGAGATDNASIVSTTASTRLVRVREGERVRVDLPAVQTLQFHVPIRAAGGSTGTAPASGNAANAGPARSGAGAGASGVVFFEAVSAFAARFALAGNSVRIDLVPLRTGDVAAPYTVAAGGDSSGRVTLVGRVGEWIALGDTDLPTSGQSLNATAEPPSQPSVWVRVEPDPGDRP